MNTSRVIGSPSGQAASSTGGCARCCTTCTSTGPRQPATLRKPLTRSRSGPRSASNVSSARANTVQSTGDGSVHTKLAMPSLWSASATKPAWPPVVAGAVVGRFGERARIEVARDRGDDAGAAVEFAQALGQPLDGVGVGEIGLRDHQAVGEDRLLARLRRPFERRRGRRRRRPPRPRPRRGTRRRARGRSRTSAGSGRDRRGRWSRSGCGGTAAPCPVRARPPAGAARSAGRSGCCSTGSRCRAA